MNWGFEVGFVIEGVERRRGSCREDVESRPPVLPELICRLVTGRSSPKPVDLNAMRPFIRHLQVSGEPEPTADLFVL